MSEYKIYDKNHTLIAELPDGQLGNAFAIVDNMRRNNQEVSLFKNGKLFYAKPVEHFANVRKRKEVKLYGQH